MISMMLGASSAFATPIGYQTNLMVIGRGGYATDIGDGQLDDGDIKMMHRHKAVVTHMAERGHNAWRTDQHSPWRLAHRSL